MQLLTVLQFYAAFTRFVPTHSARAVFKTKAFVLLQAQDSFPRNAASFIFRISQFSMSQPPSVASSPPPAINFATQCLDELGRVCPKEITHNPVNTMTRISTSGEYPNITLQQISSEGEQLKLVSEVVWGANVQCVQGVFEV